MSLDIKQWIRSSDLEQPVAHGSVGVFEDLFGRSRCGEARKNIPGNFLGRARGELLYKRNFCDSW
jgi:hypothetical protein